MVELQRCKIITYCKFCRKEGNRVRCTVRTRYAPPMRMRDWYKHYACDEHSHLIEEPDPHGVGKARREAHQKDSPPRDDRLTEADYQTWYNL